MRMMLMLLVAVVRFAVVCVAHVDMTEADVGCAYSKMLYEEAQMFEKSIPLYDVLAILQSDVKDAVGTIDNPAYFFYGDLGAAETIKAKFNVRKDIDRDQWSIAVSDQPYTGSRHGAVFKGFTLLHIAANFSRFNAAESLLKHDKSHVNTKASYPVGATALYFAARAENINMFELIHKNGGKIDAKLGNGRNLLHEAVAQGSMLMVEYLLGKYKADLFGDSGAYSLDDEGLNAAHIAVLSGHKVVLECLHALDSAMIAKPAEPSKKTALHFAVMSDSEEMVSHVLQNVADVNAVDVNGKTAFHVAVQQGHLAIAKLLVNAKIDVSALDKDGRKAEHYAKHHNDVARYLKEESDKIAAAAKKKADAEAKAAAAAKNAADAKVAEAEKKAADAKAAAAKKLAAEKKADEEKAANNPDGDNATSDDDDSKATGDGNDDNDDESEYDSDDDGHNNDSDPTESQ